jgi:hypothetical protein
MQTIRHIPLPLIVALSLVVCLMPVGLAVSAPAEQRSRGSSGLLYDTSTHPPQQDQHGPLIFLRVWALVPEKVKLSDPAQGTVWATVLAIDAEINQIKVQTDEGQRLGLFLPPETLARLRLGTRCLLQVAPRSMQDASRPPEHDETFW